MPSIVAALEDWPAYNHGERRHIGLLLRRRAFLLQLLEDGLSISSFDDAEAAALEWALNELQRAEVLEEPSVDSDATL